MIGLRRVLVGLACAFALAACGSDPTPTPAPPCPTEPPTSVSAQATLEGAELATMKVGGAVEGEIVMELYGDEAPIATANFVALARCGFYDGITFHRVISGFVIQAGDPQTKQNRGDFAGLGGGGPGYEFEIEPPAEGLRYDPYVGGHGQATPRARPTAASSSSPRRPRRRRCARSASTRSSARSSMARTSSTPSPRSRSTTRSWAFRSPP